MRGTVKQLPKGDEPGIITAKKQNFSFNLKDVKERDRQSLAVSDEVDFTGNQYALRATQIGVVGGAKKESQKVEKPKEQKQSKSLKPTKPKHSPPPQAKKEQLSQSQSKPVGQQPSQSTQTQTATSHSKTGFPAPSEAQPEPPNGFVNPYNFVPLGEKEPKREKPESHEYFVGNSGRITCKLILKTPFFTPHPERQWQVPKDSILSAAPSWIDESVRALIGNAKEHDVLGLLRNHDGNPFLPGSLLKGSFRTVAEALSNSCLGVIDFQWELLEKPNDLDTCIRQAANYFSQRAIYRPKELYVGKVKKVPSVDRPGEIEVKHKLRVFLRQPRSVINGPVPLTDLTTFTDGDTTTANRQLFHYRRQVQGRNLEINAAKDIAAGRISGELKITGITEAKNSQRFIYSPSPPRSVSFDSSVELKYNRAHRAAIDEDKKLSGRFPFADPSDPKAGKRGIHHELKAEDIVYFTETGGIVKDMGPVEVYRVLYKHSLDEILNRNQQKEFLTCHEPDKLCTCCRIFGWVPPTGDEETSTTSRKGFVHFSTATIDQTPEEIQTTWVTLKPLGKPHPSCWQFYLHAEESGPNAGYNDDNATINGRKLYWHKPGTTADSVKDERKTEQRQPQPPDNQNKTVELLLEKTKQNTETAFTFTVDFENLSDADLGLLLLTLQPNLLGEGNIPSDKLYHHLGMGKPLGLGSADVKITEFTVIDRAKRYQSLIGDGKTVSTNPAESQPAKDSIDAFVAKALAEQGKPSGRDDDRRWFATMKHIEPLLLMLDFKNFEDTPESVQYPPGDYPDTRNHSKKYWESFNWFTHEHQRASNRRKHKLWPPRDILGDEKHNPKRQDAYPPDQLPQPDQGNQTTPRQGGRYRQRRGRR
jgi:CRISPR-associated protein (TIGR03986 family)